MRYVSDLRKNLLSFRVLEGQEYKSSSTDGALKISKGSMTVLKTERTINLYKVIGSVVIGDASIIT